MGGITDAVADIIGKTIDGIVVKQSTSNSLHLAQVFLLFSDGMHFEIYSNDISLCGGIDPGGLLRVRKYMDDVMQIVFEAYPDEDGEIIIHRNLKARASNS